MHLNRSCQLLEVIKKHQVDKDFRLVAANGTRIVSYGARPFSIKLGGCLFRWTFILADVETPLLGPDFLAHYGLLVDVRNKRLLDLESFASFPLRAGPRMPPIYMVGQSKFDDVLQEFPDVFQPVLKQNPNTEAKHGIYHHIKTTGPPVYSKFRRLSPEKLRDAKQAFQEMVRMGVCRKASSPWASPLHMVRKPDGTWRPCGDYRRLNLITVPDHYPLPNMADLMSSLHGARVFSKLDLLKGYFQVPVHPDDVSKTAIITPFGTYVFHYSTFGLRNSGATFQRLMDGLLGDLPFCICYVDDILIFSKDEEEHRRHLRAVLEILRANGLVVRFDKCIFGARQVEFLGHELSASGVRPLASKVETVAKFPTPANVKSLQEFIGMVNYYHRFLPGLAGKLAPLYQALSDKPKSLEWGSQQEDSFRLAKQSLVEATELAFPVPGATLTLTTDASEVAIGAVLEQVVNGIPQPLAFYSRKLKPAETKYSTFDRELLAIFLSVRHFRHFLEGAQFKIFTDHQPLVHAFTKSRDAWSARQQRQLSAIAEFGCTIQYVPGRTNPVADALSRIVIDSVHLGIDYNEMAAQQELDPETNAYRTAVTSLVWRDIPFSDSGRTLLCDISTGRPRPLVPATLRRKVFNIIHGLSHPSGRATAKLVANSFVWHGMRRDVRQMALHCMACQASKITRHTDSGVGTFKQPRRRFGHLHVDIVGPLPPSDGARYLFTSVDRSTRWPEAIPMAEATTAACAEALLHGWVSRFGVPDDMTSDRGPSFMSDLWSALAQLMGTTIHHTTAYNPAANSMVERSHHSLKAALMARCTDGNWKA